MRGGMTMKSRNERLERDMQECPRCRGRGCYDCGGYGTVTELEADHLLAEDDCDFDNDF